MATRGKGEGSIYKRKDGLWCAAFELPPDLSGKRVRKVVTSKVKQKALDKMRAALDEAAKSGGAYSPNVTVANWMTYYLDDVATGRLRPRTLTGYRAINDLFITPALGKKPLNKVTSQDVLRLTRMIQKTPKDPALRGVKPVPEGTEMLSSTYAMNVHNVLSGALKAAMQLGKVTTNPCTLAPKPTPRRTSEKALSVEQAIHLLRYVADKPDGALWATYLLSGARRGEVIGMEIERLQGGVADMSWQLQDIKNIKDAPPNFERREVRGNLYLTRPKSSAGWRVFPLVEPLKSILERHIGDRKEGFVFLRPNGKCWRPERAYMEWKKILAEAGLPTDVKLHGARHTMVDLLYEAGVSEAVIMEIVGHSTRAVTRGYRTKGNDRIKADALTSVSKLLGIES